MLARSLARSLTVEVRHPVSNPHQIPSLTRYVLLFPRTLIRAAKVLRLRIEFEVGISAR